MSSAVVAVGYDALARSLHRDAKAARDQADWLAWLELGGHAPRTLSDYEWATNRILKFYPALAFDEIGDQELLHVMRDFPARSRRERVAAMKSWFKWGVQTRRLERNPFDLLPTIRQVPRRIIDVFSDEEVERLIALPENDGSLMMILLYAGLRRGEARKLRRRDARFEPIAEIYVRDSKGGKDRMVQIGSELEGRLRLWFRREELRPNDYLWPTRPGGYYLQRKTPMGNCSFQKWWRDCIAAAQVEYRNPHTTRHTYATRWLRKGGRLSTLSKTMGHSSTKTTSDFYEHLDTSDVIRDLRLIEGGEK